VRVAVTGASGYAGRALVAALESAGHDVNALARRETNPPAAGTRRRAIVGDVRSAAALDTLLDGADAIAHLAAWVHRPTRGAAARRECFDVNLGGTRALIEAASRRGAALPMVFVSTVAVYGARFERASESSPTAPATPYAESKLAAEAAVLGAARVGVPRARVLRPAVIIGPGAPGNVERLVRWQARGAVPLLASGGGAKSAVHVDDLAAAIVRALTLPPGEGRAIYNIAAEPPITAREMVECLARGAGRAPRIVAVPDPLADLAGLLGAAAAWLSGGTIPDLARALALLRAPCTVDASAAARELGVRFRPPGEALEAMGRGAAGAQG
jgi:nucleoside-diphosphate-sugar epimerase